MFPLSWIWKFRAGGGRKFSRTFVGVRGKRRRVAYAFFSGVIEICRTGNGKECVVTLHAARSLRCWPLRSSHGGRSERPGRRWQPPSPKLESLLNISSGRGAQCAPSAPVHRFQTLRRSRYHRGDLSVACRRRCSYNAVVMQRK